MPPARKAPASGPSSPASINGAPVTLIAEAVFARAHLLAQGRARGGLRPCWPARPTPSSPATSKQTIEDIRQALYASKIISYAQGYMLHAATSREQLQVEAQLRRHRADVARRLHHPQPFPRRHQGRLRPQPGPDQPRARPVLHRRAEEGAGRLAPHRGARRDARHSRRRRSPTRWRSTIPTAPRGCPPTCSRPSAITSAPTPTSASTSRAANSSTPTGPARAAPPPRRPTTPRPAAQRSGTTPSCPYLPFIDPVVSAR